MSSSGLSILRAREGEPWFRASPLAGLGVAGLLFVGVSVLRFAADDAADASVMLYMLPVALIGLAFGRWAGAVAGLLAVVLTAAWVLTVELDLTWVGWASRVVPPLLLGVLIGDASDRLAAADEQRRILEAAAQRHRDAAEVNDTLVQGMAAARWAFEGGRHEVGMRTLEETLAQGHELVSKLLRDADMGADGHRGTPVAR
ncbi:MAG: hypothetical protein ACTHKG_20630 [Nocardioides sp.]